VRRQGERIDHISVIPNENDHQIEMDLPALGCAVRVVVYTSKPSTVTLDDSPVEWHWSDEQQILAVVVGSTDSKHKLVIRG